MRKTQATKERSRPLRVSQASLYLLARQSWSAVNLVFPYSYELFSQGKKRFAHLILDTESEHVCIVMHTFGFFISHSIIRVSLGGIRLRSYMKSQEDLTRTFHHLRQDGIDEELFDIISGIEALSAVEK
jgi:hypothetical protein